LATGQGKDKMGSPRRINLNRKDSVMHPDMETYLWITVKAFGFALVGIYATRIAFWAYEAMKWGV
jgi:hypothetical protein